MEEIFIDIEEAKDSSNPESRTVNLEPLKERHDELTRQIQDFNLQYIAYNRRLNSETVRDGMVSFNRVNSNWEESKKEIVERIKVMERQNVVKERLVAVCVEVDAGKCGKKGQGDY